MSWYSQVGEEDRKNRKVNSWQLRYNATADKWIVSDLVRKEGFADQQQVVHYEHEDKYTAMQWAMENHCPSAKTGKGGNSGGLAGVRGRNNDICSRLDDRTKVRASIAGKTQSKKKSTI